MKQFFTILIASIAMVTFQPASAQAGTLSNGIRSLHLTFTANTAFRLYRMPGTENFIASFTAPKTGKATLLIKNTIGQTVYSDTIIVIKGHNNATINTTNLKTGMYYVHIMNDEVNFNGKMQKM